METVRDYLARESRAAHQAVIQLQRTLANTLERMGATACLASLDVELVRDFTTSSLPEADLSSVANGVTGHVPWWATWSDKIAVWAVQRILERRNGIAVQETVTLHQHKLRTWFKQTVDQLVDAYESQADIIRQQMRRAAGVGERAEQGDTHGVQA